MPTPKFRTSSSKRNMRRSHHHLTPAGMSVCSNCGNVKKPHSVCEDCGHHKGKAVLPAKVSASNSEFTAES
ncbi:MAG: 50S ribosomal protein L32 [Proteobacteria bacterium]|nr:50S ribosomal protein L32 [Pseudomonadota bacterium]